MAKIKSSRVHIFLTVVIAVLSTSADAAYIGCYKEQFPVPLFTHNPGAYGKSPLTPQTCYTLCGKLNFNYAALGAGKFCRCSNKSPEGVLYEDSSSNKCSMTCPGSADKCGSETFISVYQTPIPVELTLTVPVNTVPSRNPITLTHTTEPSGIGFNLRTDYDDDGLRTSYAENGTGLFSHTYYQAGEYQIRSYITDVNILLPDVETATYVRVETPPDGVVITCPNVTATFDDDYMCFIQVTCGTNMELQIDYRDGDAGPDLTETIQVSDAMEYSLGGGVQEHILATDLSSYISGTSTGGLIVQHGNPARYSGTLVGFEYHGVDTGSLQVYVYRPDCGSQVYCFETNTCETTCAKTCSGSGGYCSDVDDCCDTQTPRSTSLLPIYNKVHTITMSSVNPGYGFESAPPGLDIQPGDVIAHQGLPTPLIANGAPEVPATMLDFYCTGLGTGPLSFTAGQCAVTTELHQLKAIYCQHSVTMFPLAFTNPGSVTFQATARSLDQVNIAGTSYSSVGITVLEGVNAAILDVPIYVAATVPTDFSVEPYTGSPADIDWDFEVGTDSGVDAKTVSFTYPAIGEYNLTVNISNAVSFKFNFTTIIVEELITGLTVNSPGGLYVAIGEATNIDMTLATGSDYVCDFQFTYEDGTVELLSRTVSDGLNFNHVFSTTGDVNLDVNCYNNLGSLTETFTYRAVERLTNVVLSPGGARAGEPFRFVVIWDYGTEVTFNWFKYDGVDVPMLVDETLRQATSIGEQPAAATGAHSVSFDISNPISSVSEPGMTFSIEIEITDAVIECVFLDQSIIVPDADYNLIPVNSGVDCTVDMTDGTSVEIFIDYGDGSNTTLSASPGEAWASAVTTLSLPVTHNYATTGYFQLQVTVSNAFNSVDMTYPVGVMVCVDSTDMDPVSPVIFGPPAELNFTFTSGEIPNDVRCTIYWGDGNFDEYYPCDVTDVFPHAYLDRVGNLMLEYTLENPVCKKTASLPVSIVSPIKDEECFISNKAASKDEPIGLNFKARRAPSAGELSLTFDCDTSKPGTLITRVRQNDGPDAIDTEDCTYTTTGIRTMSIRAVSLLEDITCTHTFEVLNPVKDEFDVFAPTAPVDYEVDPTCKVDYSIDYTGAQLPDNAEVIINRGDNTTFGPVPFSAKTTDIYYYPQDGHYISTITIYNDASEVKKTILTGCYAQFCPPSIQVLRTPSIPLNSSDEPGYGSAENMFRADEPIRIHTDLPCGTFVWWEVSAVSSTDIYSCNSTDDIITLNIDKYGDYDITITPKNPVHSGPPYTYQATVIPPVRNISISEYGTTNANDDKDFNVSMISYGYLTCVAVDFGVDDIELYGDPTTCSDTAVLQEQFPDKSFKTGITTDVSQSFNLRHQYMEKGTYLMKIFAWDIISNASAEFQFVVSDIDCQAPNIGIRDRSRDFRLPKEFRRCNRIKLTGVTNIACPNTLNNVKLWTVFNIDPLTGAIEDEVSMANVPSSTNAELAIPKLLLGLGKYLVKYKVTMLATSENEEEFSSVAETYIKVIPCDIIVALWENSMSQRTFGPNEYLTLCPRQYSYDPDVDTANGEIDVFDSFKMACRDLTLNEPFPDESVEVFALNKTDLSPSHVDANGCFQQGPGWIKDFDGCITFKTDIFKHYHNYEITVKGKKGTRDATARGQVLVMPIAPPDCEMEFKIPWLLRPTASGKSFNPNSRLGVRRKTLIPCESCTFHWDMFAYDLDFCDDFGCLRDLAYLGRYIDGTESDELTVHVEVFEKYPHVDLFQLRLTCTDNDTGISGTSSLNLTRNYPPAGGNCTFSPQNGITMNTSFTIDCRDFTDLEDEILSYAITCQSAHGVVGVVGDKWPHWEDKLLPLGDPAADYTLKCNVTVTDDLGSAGTYPIEEVTVDQISMEEYKAMLMDMSSSDNDIVAVIVAVANLEQASGLVGALIPMMEEMREQDEFSVYAGFGTVASQFSSTMGSNTSSRPYAFEQVNDDPEALEQFENIRNAAANTVQQLSLALTKATAESAAETKSLSKSVSEISNAKSYLTRDTQGKLTELLERARDNVVNHAETMSVEEVIEITENTMAACSNIGESAAISGDYPITSDLYDMEDEIVEYDTNLNSDLEEIAVVTDEKAQYKAGLRVYNKEEQNNFASGNLKKCNSYQDSLMGVLINKQPKSPTPVRLNSPSFEAAIWKNDATKLVNQSVKVGDSSVDVPPDALSGVDPHDTYTLTISTTAGSQVPLSNDSPASRRSQTISINFKNSKGEKLQTNNLKTPIRLNIKQDPNTPKVNLTGLPLSNPKIPENRYDEVCFYHEVEVTNTRAALQLKFILTNRTKDTQLLVLFNYGVKPELDPTRSKVKTVCMIPSDTEAECTDDDDDDATEPDACTCFVDSDSVAENKGKWYICVRQLLPDELNSYKQDKDLPKQTPTKWKENKEFLTDYAVSVGEITCAYFKDGDSELKRDGVKPSPLSTQRNVICDTNHLTTFAGGWAVAPNTIDWNFVFSNADFFKNPTLYITEIVIVIAYIIAMIWARRQDKQDLEKLGLAPLLDNDPRDKYYYEVMVSTGMRRGAGTESKVHFILSGEEEETEVRTFEDKKRPIFTRGSISGFLLSVPEPLGALSYLRIWHDNSGKGRTASWYLNHVTVHDVQTNKKYYFISNRWFAVEEDDGQVDRVIPVAGKEQMTEFSHLFAETATKNLSDGHLWFSVVARPPQSRFTRCQRVSCCLCLLFTSMLANAMFYGTETSDANAFQFGPFALTSEQIFIGVISNIIIFPVNFLLITLFRKSRPRKLRPSRVEEAIKSKPEHSTSMADVNPRVKSALDFERPGSSFLMDTKRSQSSMSRPESSMSGANIAVVDAEKVKKKKKCELPWWFTIVAWILLWIAVLVSTAFVTFYGIMFQDIKCKKWITSMLISFFMSVFFTQPIKVFLLAIFLSLVIKNPGGDDDEEEDEETRKSKTLETDEEYMHEEDEFGFVAPRKPMYKPKPPDTKSLEAARQQRLKEIQMWSVIREILFYAFFLWILLVISYRNVSTDSYNYKYNMQKVFILTNDTNKAFSKVKNTNDFWSWAKSGMLRGLRAGPYYNDFPAFYMRGYINDKQSRLMGYAVLRQARTKPNTCRVPKYMEASIEECNAAYDIVDEEDGDFGPGWSAMPVNSTREEYKFQTASSLDGYPYWGEMALYGGGGYVIKLNRDYKTMKLEFDQLEKEGWIDKYTRAVFLEFTVYNPSINLFSVSTLLAEFRPSGGVFTSFRFEPCNLLPYMNPAILFQIICEIIYFAFTVFFICKEIRYMIKQKKEYFFQFWNLVDLAICAMSVTAIVIYFYRLFCINELSEYFNKTNGNEYMKFQYVGYWSEIFNYIIGFLVFFATLKFLKLLRFNRKISMLSDTLRNSSKHLLHFSIIFNIVFLAFMQVFYLVFMSHLDIFKTFLSSCEAGIVMMMGKFDIYSMLGVNQWITQVFIFLFVVTVTFIVVNMLLSILNDTFTAVRNDKNKQQNDYEIVDFMLGRFKMWTGIGRGNTTITPAEMEERNQRYKTLEGQIDYFPDQIDRFLASISNMYMGDDKFEAFLHKGMAKKMAMKAQQAETPHPVPRYPGALRISHGARGMTDVQTD